MPGAFTDEVFSTNGKFSFLLAQLYENLMHLNLENLYT